MYHLQINHHEKELNYFDRAIYNSMINFIVDFNEICIFLHFVILFWKKGVPPIITYLLKGNFMRNSNML